MRKRRVPPPPPDKPVRFIACDENKQTFNWQKTNGRASQRPEEISLKKN